jgi:hypothetical protein
MAVELYVPWRLAEGLPRLDRPPGAAHSAGNGAGLSTGHGAVG